MAQPRFATARELFDSFPSARYHVLAKPTDQSSVEFIRSLAATGQQRDAISCCAYLLPRREAVWWACQCVRAAHKPADEDEALLQRAEAWVRTPEEENRLEALRASAEGDPDSAALWACRAAAWSGGVVDTNAKGPVRAEPDATAKAVRAAVLIALTKVGMKGQDPTMKGFIDMGLQLVQRDLSGV